MYQTSFRQMRDWFYTSFSYGLDLHRYSYIALQKTKSTKNIVQKIVLCDVQKEVFPEIEKALLSLLHISGYPDVKCTN